MTPLDTPTRAGDVPVSADGSPTPMHVTALVPAHNEEESLGATIEALLAQDRPADEVVVIPNGCTDGTADVARRYPVTVVELPRLEHRKSEALNRAWARYARDSDMVICLDADTVLPPTAIGDWERELAGDSSLGGSSSKFTMQQPGLLPRLQKAEFATWTDTSLRRGETSVLAGTGCAIRGEALRSLAARPDREGPWTYTSATEDFELTYRIRQAGWRCHVSPTVRAYTDSMPTVKALWGQRMKWQAGTIEDLLSFGLNHLTWRDWGQQALGLLNAAARALWLFVILGALALGLLNVAWYWIAFPFLFIALDVYRATRIPHRDRTDLLIAGSFFPNEFFMWLRAGWFLASWSSVLWSRATHRTIDRWAAQYAAEGGM
jgi:poly-beta-1,6-N-acetyl-D-glucosamine synthase